MSTQLSSVFLILGSLCGVVHFILQASQSMFSKYPLDGSTFSINSFLPSILWTCRETVRGKHCISLQPHWWRSHLSLSPAAVWTDGFLYTLHFSINCESSSIVCTKCCDWVNSINGPPGEYFSAIVLWFHASSQILWYLGINVKSMLEPIAPHWLSSCLHMEACVYPSTSRGKASGSTRSINTKRNKRYSVDHLLEVPDVWMLPCKTQVLWSYS